ncbi:MAG: hypothetical protein Kow0047_16310 [Anaerolineae bacterium]
MNLKLKRLVRTECSEQYALFDLDRKGVGAEPLSVGKLDLHFTPDGVYGTLLLWKDAAEGLSEARRRALAEALLMEICQPAGMMDSFAVEVFLPSLDSYELIHNMGETDEDEALGD